MTVHINAVDNEFTPNGEPLGRQLADLRKKGGVSLLAGNDIEFEFVGDTQWPKIWEATELVSQTVNLGDGFKVMEFRIGTLVGEGNWLEVTMTSESPGDQLVISSRLGIYQADDPCAALRAMHCLGLLETSEQTVLADDLVKSAYLTGARLKRTKRQEACVRLIIDRIGECAYDSVMELVPPALPSLVSFLTQQGVVIEPITIWRELNAGTVEKRDYSLCRRCLRQMRQDTTRSMQLFLIEPPEVYAIHANARTKPSRSLRE